MKLRVTSLLICLILALNLFTGCFSSETSSPESSSTVSQESVETSLASSSEISADASSETDGSTEDSKDEPIDPPEIEETDFFTKYGQGNLPETAVIPDYCTPTKTDYLYNCDIAMPNVEGFSVYAANNVLLLFYWDGDQQYCEIISLETGKSVKKIEIAYDSEWGQLTNGEFWVVNRGSLEVKIYDTKGNETILRKGVEAEVASVPNTVHVTDDKKYLLVAWPDDKDVEIHSLENGEIIKPEIPANLDVWEFYETSKGIYMGNGDMGAVYNLEANTLETFFFDEMPGCFYGDVLEFLVEEKIKLGATYGDGEYFYASIDIDQHMQDLKYGYAAISDSFSNCISFYDLRNGVGREIQGNENAYGLHSVILENGTVLIIELFDKGTAVYIYDLVSAFKDEKGLTTIETYVYTDAELKNEIDEIAETIYAETGAEVIYGSEGNDFNIYDYVGVAELDLFKIYTTVTELREILNIFPKGMLVEAYSETNKGLRLYLCGDIYGTKNGSLDTAGGVTADQNGYISVVLDVKEDLWYNIPHEFSHVFDKRIQALSLFGENDWMAIWDAATPFENAYTYSYEDYYDNVDFTIFGEERNEDVWFTDDYARTFPTEDRARILENLFIPETDSAYKDIYVYENVVNKAKLYCYILRQCFPSCNTDAVNYWETNLGVIDSSVVPDVETPVPVG